MGYISSNVHWKERRKAAEDCFGSFAHANKGYSALWEAPSDATGAFYTASFISFMGSFPCIFACLWQNLESCHSPQQILKELPWLKHTNSNALLVSFQQPARWAPFTNIPTSQGSHCCFGCKEAFSLAVSFPKNILHAESCAHYPYSQPS